jgi:molybdate transport system substrate-binding protein
VRRVLATPALLLVLLTACGGGSTASSSGRPSIDVAAASSLQQAFTALGQAFAPARVRLSFAGSDLLAAQIEAGGRPDVYAAANAKLPDALYAKGLLERPVTFARNQLVLAVPSSGARVRALADLERRGTTLAIGAASVPVGAYTRTVLAHLPAAERKAILANVRSDEPDVAGVVGKIAQGAVDAGFVYASDVRAAGGRLRAIALPAALQPQVRYEAAVVRGTSHPAQARAFLAALTSAAGRAALQRAGFLLP